MTKTDYFRDRVIFEEQKFKSITALSNIPDYYHFRLALHFGPLRNFSATVIKYRTYETKHCCLAPHFDL